MIRSDSSDEDSRAAAPGALVVGTFPQGWSLREEQAEAPVEAWPAPAASPEADKVAGKKPSLSQFARFCSLAGQNARLRKQLVEAARPPQAKRDLMWPWASQ